jgi:hypothetical protein
MSVRIVADTFEEFVSLFRTFLLSRNLNPPELLLNPAVYAQHEYVKSICAYTHQILNSYRNRRCIEIKYPKITEYPGGDDFTFIMNFSDSELKEIREYSPMYDRDHTDLIPGIDIIRVTNLPVWKTIGERRQGYAQEIVYAQRPPIRYIDDISHNCYFIYNIIG